MKALAKIKRGAGNIGVIEVDDPFLGEGDVLIEVAAAGCCDTDFVLIDWTPTIEKEYRPTLPLVMGHEFSGYVRRVGNRVEGFEMGDRVVVNPILYCGRCPFCLEGRQQLCNRRTLLGFQRNGGFAEKVSVRSENVYKLPEEVDLEVAALCEPFNIIINAFERARPDYGDTLLIAGAGPLAIMALLMGQFSGCGKIVVAGLEADREGLRLAEELGAVAINMEREDLRERIRDMTQGAGVDMAIETPGGSKAIGEDLSVLKKRAKLVLVGLTENPIHLSRSAFFLRETEMIGIRAHNPKTWEICLKVLSTGKMNLRPLITHRLPLEEGEKGFQLLRQGKGLKILLNPGHQN